MDQKAIVYVQMEYYSSIKKGKLRSFTATWMELEGIISVETSQKEKEILDGLTYVEHRENKQKEKEIFKLSAELKHRAREGERGLNRGRDGHKKIRQ